MLAASISFFVKPRWESRSKSKSSSRSAGMPSVCVQNSSPSVHLLNTNLMSKADARPFSTACSSFVVKPRALRAAWLMPGASASVPWPTAYLMIVSISASV